MTTQLDPQKVAVLKKVALDAAFELRAISNIIGCVNHDEMIKLDALISRLYAACEALGPEPEQSHINLITTWPQFDHYISSKASPLNITNSGVLEEETHL